MTLTVRDLVSLPELDLRLVHAGRPGALDEAVAWSHQSELDDPQLFSSPGEILLTTGLAFPVEGTIPAEEMNRRCETYMALAESSQVVAIGFGIGIRHDSIPAALVAASEARGVPLFEIPGHLPFSAITKAISRAFAANENALLRRAHAAQRRLVADANRPEPVRALVRSTAELAGGWAAFCDASGRLVELSHVAARERALAAFATHANSGRPATFIDEPQASAVVYDVTDTDGMSIGALACGMAVSFDSTTGAIPLLAANLLAVTTRRAREESRRLRRLRSIVMSRLLDGEVSLARQVARDLWDGLPSEPVRVICVAATQRRRNSIEVALESTASSAVRSPVAWGAVDDYLWLVCATDQAEQVASRLGADPEAIRGVSGGADWGHIVRARQEAAASALVALAARSQSAARPTGRTSMGPSVPPHALAAVPVSGTELVRAVIPPDAANAFARVTLAPLLGDNPDTALLRDTLRAWLQHGMTLEATAASTGLHRHTVRRRLAMASERLGVDVSDPEVCHELWLAFRLLSA